MAHILKGIVKGMRPVTGEYPEADRKGQFWYFLSLEILDPMWGEVYSCQLAETDKQYKEFVESTGQKKEDGSDERTLKKDLKDHNVKVSIFKQTAGERSINQRVFKAGGGDKNITREKQNVPVVRSQVTNIRDEGLPEDEE